MTKKVLIFNLKRKYFLDIKNGFKKFEYRLKTSYWSKRLVGIDYDEVQFRMGYPRKDEDDKIIKCKYLGYEEQTIKHEHFNYVEEEVFAIVVKLNKDYKK